MSDLKKEIHWLVDFAARYERATLKSFNAFSALIRAENLQADIQALSDLRNETEQNGIQFGSFDGSF